MIDKVAGAAVQGANEVAKAPKAESFGKALQQAKARVAAPQGQHRPQVVGQAQQAERAQATQAAQRAHKPNPVTGAKPTHHAAPVAHKPQAEALLNEVSAAQSKLDSILKMAESGRTFSPAELLAFQAHAYRASQELDLAGKVVEKATSGVKQTLNTQV